MQDFMSSFKFIIAFLIMTILFNMVFGAKAATRFLQIVLLSVVLVNATKIIEWVDNTGIFPKEE